VWEEGMYLAPQHFQAQRRHVEEAVAHTIDVLFPYAWGVAALALDEEALRNGALVVRHARGILPDGTPLNVPEIDAAPEPIALAERFSPTRDAHVVLLALRPWQRDAANVADPDGDGGNGHAANGARAASLRDARYVAVEREVTDEVSGRDAVPVRFATKALRVVLDDDAEAGDVRLPIARVRRDGTGRFALDTDYVPPCLQLGASPRLLELLRGIVGMLEAKGATLATLARAESPTDAAASAYAGNEVAARWMLHAVRSAEAPLRHLLATRTAHPERLWRELSRLAGALCTFALGASARELPTYDHDELAGAFDALERHLRAQLEVVVSSRVVVVPLRREGDVLHVGAVADARCFDPGARWFLAVRTALGPVETAQRVPTLAKACASRFVLELVRRAYPGLALEHVPAPPPALAPRADRAYFAVTLAGPCAQALTETREMGVYVPDGLPDAEVELAVLVRG